jgi:hypothetical protein
MDSMPMIEACMRHQDQPPRCISQRHIYVTPMLTINNGERTMDIFCFKEYYPQWEEEVFRINDSGMPRFCSCGHDYLYQARHEFKDHIAWPPYNVNLTVVIDRGTVDMEGYIE